MTNKLTREEKRNAVEAERRAKAIESFRKHFLHENKRGVYSKKAVFETDDASQLALYTLVEEFNRTRDSLTREIRSCTEVLAESLRRIAVNERAFYWSNGITGRNGVDIDRYEAKVESLRFAINQLGQATGWRVREIESDTERAFADMLSNVSVEPSGGGFGVRRWDPDGRFVWLHGESMEFKHNGTSYATEDDAYAALHVLVYGRPVR